MTTVSAQTTVSVGGVSLTRATTGNGGNSGPAVKTWVNARISIAPNATNAVGEPHTFTVTLEVDPGTGTFGPAAGQHVDVTLTDSNGAAHTAPTGTLHERGRQHQRGRTVHDHLQLAVRGPGNRSRHEHPLRQRLGTIHRRDRRLRRQQR